jgi:hypothetical protein
MEIIEFSELHNPNDFSRTGTEEERAILLAFAKQPPNPIYQVNYFRWIEFQTGWHEAKLYFGKGNDGR